MRIDIATLFPKMCAEVFSESIVGRGIKGGFIEIYAHNIRDYTENRHNNVDDKPYGGGTGMIMQAQPIYDCVKTIAAQHKTRPRIIYLSPKGEVFSQKKAVELSREDGLILICGHYEGVDERVLEELDAEEISVGDYVLTGGELPALIITDAIARLQPGVLPNSDAYSIESHFNGLLEFPQYSRPEVWRGRRVPEVLLSGNHEIVREWQENMSLEVTAKKRPDLYRAYIDGKIAEIRQRFSAEHNLDESVKFTVISLPDEQLRAVLRGKLREIECGCGKDEYLILTNERNIPKCVAVVTKSAEKSAFIKVLHKNTGERND